MAKQKRLRKGQRLKVFSLAYPTRWQTATFDCYIENRIVVYLDDWRYSHQPLGENRKFEIIPGQIVRYWQVWEVSSKPQLIKNKEPNPVIAKTAIAKLQTASIETALSQRLPIPHLKYEVRPVFRRQSIPNHLECDRT